jgi:hypothetical protein
MSCPTYNFTPPNFDTGLASSLQGTIASAISTLAQERTTILTNVNTLERELESFKFESEFKFDAPEGPPGPPSITPITVVPATPTNVVAPAAGALNTPNAPRVEIDGFAESSLSTPNTPADLGAFSRPSAPSGGSAIAAPAVPDFSGAVPPTIALPGGAPDGLNATLPSMPMLAFEFDNLLNIAGYSSPTVPDIPQMNAQFLLSDALDEYGWLVYPETSQFLNQWLDDAASYFTRLKNRSDVTAQVASIYGQASSLWERAGVASSSGNAEFVTKATHRYGQYLDALEQNFDLRTNVAAKGAALEKIAIAVTVRAAVEMTGLEHRIARINQKLDARTAELELFVEQRRAETARARAGMEAEKAGYIARGIQAEVFEQKVRTSASIVSANRAAASGAMSAAEAAGALVEIDEAAVGAARARIEAAQAQVQALKSKEITAELDAAVFKGEVQRWRATLSAAAADVTANKAELAVVSAKNQALSQQVAAINSANFTKVAAAQLSVAKAQASGAQIKTDALTVAAEIQRNTSDNKREMVDARINYLNTAANAAAPTAKNEATAAVNEAIARSNQAVSSITGDANTGIRQAAQNQATASTSMTDVAFRYNSELAKAFAAVNAGKLSGYRISTSKRMTGDRAVRFTMAARKDKSYSGSVTQSDECETVTTHEESV